MFLEVELPNTVNRDCRAEIVVLRAASCRAPCGLPTNRAPTGAMSDGRGLRNVALEVVDLRTAVDGPAADGYGLVGGVGQHDQMWRTAGA